MKEKVGALLESRKFIIAGIVINCVIISSMILYLLLWKKSPEHSTQQNVSSEKKIEVEYTDSDSGLVNIYYSLLAGYDFDLGDGIHFNFEKDGVYSGFFDSKHTNVKGYGYKIVAENDEIKLNIFNKEKTKIISYKVVFNSKGDIVLKHPDLKKGIKLKF